MACIYRKILWLVILLTIGVSLPLFAVELPDSTVDELTSQIDRSRTETTGPIAKEEEPEIIVEDEQKTKEPESGPSVFVEEITLEGNTLYSEDEFQEKIKSYSGRKISYTELRELTQQITNFYRAKGYITSRAFIPPQRIEEKKIRIRIMEGKVGEIILEGNKYFRDHTYINSMMLEAGKPLKVQDLERSLTLINQKPDRRVKAYLIPGLEPETTDIIIKVSETRPYHASYEFNNRGTRFTHRARHIFGLSHSSLLGFGDTFRANLTLTEENALIAGAAAYSFPIAKTGTVLSLTGSVAESKLIKSLKPSKIEGESFSIIAQITQSVLKSRRFLLDLVGAFEIKDSKTDVAEDKFSYDRVRALRIGPRMTFFDSKGRTTLNLNYRFGLPQFLNGLDNVDSLASKPNSGGEFNVFDGEVLRLQKMPFNSLLILRGGAQWTWDNLNALERFRAGGAFSVRGYPESDSTGDYGYNWSAELRIPPYGLPKTWEVPKSSVNLYDSIRLIGFIEGAKTYNHTRQNFHDVKDRTLLGAGFGLRVGLSKHVSFQFDMGFPFGDESTDERDTGQLHLSLKLQI